MKAQSISGRIDRRQLISFAAGTIALSGLSTPVRASLDSNGKADLKPLHDENFWESVRGHYSLKPGLVHLNSANLASVPTAVLRKANKLADDVSKDPSFENRAKFETSLELCRRQFAAMLGCDSGELAITRNTSESNRTVIAGLNLGPGDEVVIWDENHESNDLSWNVWSQRFGFKVVRVTTPHVPNDSEELLKAFTDKFNRRTRVVAFSHVSNRTGVALPAQSICAAAERMGIKSLVDGAQSLGLIEIDLRNLGCDFFTGSAHKWLTGPHETGLLYVRAEQIPSLWPSLVSHNWESMERSGARKFECLGQRQDGRIDALNLTPKLRDRIGISRSEQYLRALVRRLRAGLADSGMVRFFATPEHNDLSAGILAFSVKGTDPLRVMRHLYEGFGISALATPFGNNQVLIRYSPNLYNSMNDIGRAIDAVAQLRRLDHR